MVCLPFQHSLIQVPRVFQKVLMTEMHENIHGTLLPNISLHCFPTFFFIAISLPNITILISFFSLALASFRLIVFHFFPTDVLLTLPLFFFLKWWARVYNKHFNSAYFRTNTKPLDLQMLFTVVFFHFPSLTFWLLSSYILLLHDATLTTLLFLFKLSIAF